MEFTIRLDVIDDTDADQLRKYLDKYSKYLVYEEVSDKTKKLHYQGIIIVEDDKEYNAAKVRFTSMFPNHKGGKKSMAKVKKDSYAVYITKDGNKFASRGYTDEDIQLLQSKSYKKTETKASLESPFKKAYEYVCKKGLTCSSSGWEIVECLIDYYRESIKCEPNDFQLRNMAKSIHTHLVYTRAQHEDRMHVYEAYRRQRAKEIVGTTWTWPNF